MLEVNPLLEFDELPEELKTEVRKDRADDHQEVWLDLREPGEIYSWQLTAHLLVFVIDPESEQFIDDIDPYMYYITELIYCAKSLKPLARSVDNRHFLPSELQRPQLSPDSNMPVLKLFLDLYLDKFGPFRNVYHPLGGFYLVIGNLPLCICQLFSNIFVLRFLPSGAEFTDFVQPFVKEILELEKGKIERETSPVRVTVKAGDILEILDPERISSFMRVLGIIKI